MMGYKTNLKKFKRIEIMQNMLSNHREMKLEISNKKKLQKHTNMWNLNNTFLSKQCAKEENKRKIRKYI